MSTILKQRINLLAAELPRPKVVVAIEPHIYREAIGRAIRILRPHLEVAVVSPEALDSEVRRLDSGVVISGRPIPEIRNTRVAWVEYRPYDEVPAKVCLGGKHSKIEEVGLDELLLVVDESERAARTEADLARV